MNVGGYSRGVRIRKFLLHETGGYNPQYRRPYDTTMEPNTLNMVLERLGGTKHYEPSLMGGLANKFITPTATPEKMLSLVNIEISEDQYFYYHKLKASQELRFGKIFVSSSTTENILTQSINC